MMIVKGAFMFIDIVHVPSSFGSLVHPGKEHMKLYRLLSGPDDATFCARIERVLNLGWSLHGSPALTFNGSSAIVAQAIVKEVEGEYAGFVHLDDLHPEGESR
jgi:hypothetical protein